MRRRRFCWLLVLPLFLSSISADRQAASPAQRNGGRLDAWLEVERPFDEAKVRVRLTYSYVGGDAPIDLPMPSARQIAKFREVAITFDGEVPQSVMDDDLAEAPIFEERGQLEPGGAKELVFNVSDIVVIPKNWTRVEIRPMRRHPLPGVLQSVVVDRKELQRGT